MHLGAHTLIEALWETKAAVVGAALPKMCLNRDENSVLFAPRPKSPGGEVRRLKLFP